MWNNSNYFKCSYVQVSHTQTGKNNHLDSEFRRPPDVVLDQHRNTQTPKSFADFADSDVDFRYEEPLLDTTLPKSWQSSAVVSSVTAVVDSTSTNGRAAADPQPSQILVCEETATTVEPVAG